MKRFLLKIKENFLDYYKSNDWGLIIAFYLGINIGVALIDDYDINDFVEILVPFILLTLYAWYRF